jgi:hypothetical protein
MAAAVRAGARQAVALLRDILTREDPPRFVSTHRPLDKTSHGLALHLLIRCVDPNDLEHELDRIDAHLTDQLAESLLADAHWDDHDWAVEYSLRR